MNRSYLIKDYNQDSFCLDISNFTATPLSYVYEKPFIGYLNTYLLKWKTENPSEKNRFTCGISMIIESEYVDYSYIDDYSNFYSKSYYDYKKKCMRIHFFKASTKDVEGIYQFDKSINDELRNDYLGFIVVRPIPEYYIARACFRKWNENDDEHLFYHKKLSHQFWELILN